MVVESASEEGDRQGSVGEFEAKGAKLFFGSRIILTFLYLFVQFLKVLAGITILPLPLTFAVFVGLISKEFVIALTVLIYCILAYYISPRLMKPLYGEFDGLWWVMIIFVAWACVFCSLMYWIKFNPLIFILIFLLSSILFVKMMLHVSDMVQWTGPVPAFWTFMSPTTEELEKDKEDIIREYKEESDDPWIKRKNLRFVTVYTPSVVFAAFCIFLGVLFFVLLESTILFVILISTWLLNDLHYLIRKKFRFKFKIVGKVIKGIHAPECKLIKSLIFSERRALVKQMIGLICLLVGFFGVVLHYNNIPALFTHIHETPPCNGFENYMVMSIPFVGNISLAVLISYIGTILLILAVIFQLYFWYILMRRFPHFLKIWVERDCSAKVDAPKLPLCGFQNFFVINTLLIVVSFLFVAFWPLITTNNPFGEELTHRQMTIVGIAILIILFNFGIDIWYPTIKSNKLRETNPRNLYRDNLRIPFAAAFQSVIFMQLHPVAFLLSCSLIILFYTNDIDNLLRTTHKKDSEMTMKRGIKKYAISFIVAFTLLVAGLEYRDIIGNALFYTLIFPIIIVVIGFYLDIILEMKTHLK